MASAYGAILLAAGLARRFVQGDKLLHELRGKPLVQWAADVISTVSLVQRVAVIGPADDVKRKLLARAGFTVAVNPDPSHGMGSSIAAGARAMRQDLDAIFVCLGDMPDVSAQVFLTLKGTFEADESIDVLQPAYQGQRGHPVLFAGRLLPQLVALRGDEGARAIVQAAGDRARVLPVDTRGVLQDIDTVEELTHAESFQPNG